MYVKVINELAVNLKIGAVKFQTPPIGTRY
jgi:hypothetical protein